MTLARYPNVGSDGFWQFLNAVGGRDLLLAVTPLKRIGCPLTRIGDSYNDFHNNCLLADFEFVLSKWVKYWS